MSIYRTMPVQIMNDVAAAQLCYIKCEFAPDTDECEACDKPGLQLFYNYSQDGVYKCIDCVRREYEEQRYLDLNFDEVEYRRETK